MGISSFSLSAAVSSSGCKPLTFERGDCHDVFVGLKGDPHGSFLGIAHYVAQEVRGVAAPDFPVESGGTAADAEV